MGGSSQQPVTQQTTQTRDPWSQAQPHLTNIMGQAANYYNNQIGYQPFAGQMQADIDPNTANAFNAMNAIATNDYMGSPGVNAARTTGAGLISNYGLSPEMQNLYDQASTQENPYLQNILNTQGRQIADRVGSAMAGAGRYGSGQHTDVLTRALAESADPILAQDYTRRQQQRQDILSGGLQRQGQWAQLMPTLDQAQYAGADRLFGMGEYMQNRQQTDINNALRLWNQQQAWPWEQLSRFNAIVGGAGGLGGTQVTTAPGATPPSTLQRLMGGAAAGAGIGSMFAPGVGTAAGAGIGGLLGLL